MAVEAEVGEAALIEITNEKTTGVDAVDAGVAGTINRAEDVDEVVAVEVEHRVHKRCRYK